MGVIDAGMDYGPPQQECPLITRRTTDLTHCESGGSTMKSIHRRAGMRTLGLCMLMATLLSGPVVVKADLVLDWNKLQALDALDDVRHSRS
jgi:hypothetical protein